MGVDFTKAKIALTDGGVAYDCLQNELPGVLH